MGCFRKTRTWTEASEAGGGGGGIIGVVLEQLRARVGSESFIGKHQSQLVSVVVMMMMVRAAEVNSQEIVGNRSAA
jgi:hypothetical protein